MVWGRNEWEHKAETLPILDTHTDKRETWMERARVSVRKRDSKEQA